MPYAMTTNPEPMSDKLKYRDDYVGMRFGRLVVIGYPANANGVRIGGAICRCDCGNKVEVLSMSALANGNTSMCRDCRSKAISENTKNWWSEHPDKRRPFYEYSNERLYGVWSLMLKRCEDETCRGYGADGVEVCDEWHEYPAFREWALSNGYDQEAPRGECTIDRINPFGDYEPSNCRWVDMYVQAHNKRSDWLRDHPGCSKEA